MGITAITAITGERTSPASRWSGRPFLGGKDAPATFCGAILSKQRITHDTAVAAATKLTDDLRGLVREEEARDLWHLLYETFKAATEAAFMMYEREVQRLRPSKN